MAHIDESALSKLSASAESLARKLHELAKPNRQADRDHLKVTYVLQAQRREREGFFNPELLGEPGWDMLLELYADHLLGKTSSVTRISLASGTPPTTALRWFERLANAGLIVRQSDPSDGRRWFVSLSDDGLERMRDYIARVELVS